MEVEKVIAYGEQETIISRRGQNEISITVAKDFPKDQSMRIYFSNQDMERNTLTKAVSGSEIKISGDYSLFQEVYVGIKEDDNNRAFLDLIFEKNLSEDNYTIEIPAGYFTVRSADDSKLYTNKKIIIRVNVVIADLIKEELEIRIEDNKVTWNLVEGALSYKLTYYESDDEGNKKEVRTVTYQANMNGNQIFRDIYKSFPYEPDKKYTVKVIAYPLADTIGAKEEEYILCEKVGEERVASPKIKLEYSEASKANTVLRIESKNENIQHFIRLYVDSKPVLISGRGRYNNYDLIELLSGRDIKDVFYVEVCAVDLSNLDLAASEWVRSDGQTLDTQENLLSNIKNGMTKEELEEVAEKLLKHEDSDDLNQLLMTKTGARDGYTKLEEIARSLKGIDVSASIADSLKSTIDGTITTAGLALNSDEDVALKVKESEKKDFIPSGYSVAVQMDISVEPKLEKQDYPVMITMPVPKGLNVNKTIVIFHKDEKIYPIVNKEENTLTFSVTSFSNFVFTNQKDLSYYPSSPSSSSSSNSSSASSAAVNALQTNSKPGVWAKNATGRWFSFTDKTYPASQWLQVSGKWYYFDESGYVSTGWNMVDGKWYYMDAENGDMAEGWKSINGKWYFLNPADGNMAEGWKIIDGKWYYLNPNNGDMAEGWKLIDSKWYYLNPVNGDMATGKTQINGKWYYLTENGDCLISTVTPDGGKADADGVVFYDETR